MTHELFTYAGLGVRVVLVLGARHQIDELLQKQGEAPQYAAGYRVTDAVAMQATVQAAGASRMAVEAQLSKVHCRSSLQRLGITLLSLCTALSQIAMSKHWHDVLAGAIATGDSQALMQLRADALRSSTAHCHRELCGRQAQGRRGRC